jgi:hypothetical protein
MGLCNSVRLGQVRIAIKSSIIEPLRSLIHLLACFGKNFEENFSLKNDLVLITFMFLFHDELVL